MLIPKQTIIRSEKHRRWIASLSCIMCGGDDVQCSHIRLQNGGGMGMKPSDEYCVPLCLHCHRKQHHEGEVKFYYFCGGHEKASILAKQLYEVTGNTELALEEIRKWKART